MSGAANPRGAKQPCYSNGVMRLRLIIVVALALTAGPAVQFLHGQTNVFAQQETGQVVPQTRNPQTNSPQLFPKQDNLQPSGSQQLLNQTVTIKIPEGRPAKPSAETTDTGQQNKIGLWIGIAGLSLLAAAGSLMWLRNNQMEMTIAPGAAAPAKPAQELTKKPAHKNTNNFKNRPRKKRKRR